MVKFECKENGTPVLFCNYVYGYKRIWSEAFNGYKILNSYKQPFRVEAMSYIIMLNLDNAQITGSYDTTDSNPYRFEGIEQKSNLFVIGTITEKSPIAIQALYFNRGYEDDYIEDASGNRKAFIVLIIIGWGSVILFSTWYFITIYKGY